MAHTRSTLYHRVETPIGQTSAVAKQQVASKEIWCSPSIYGIIPSVKAYRGPLPSRTRGIEFTTAIAPTKGSGTPYIAYWYADGSTPGVTINNFGFAVITVLTIKNEQP